MNMRRQESPARKALISMIPSGASAKIAVNLLGCVPGCWLLLGMRKVFLRSKYHSGQTNTLYTILGPKVSKLCRDRRPGSSLSQKIGPCCNYSTSTVAVILAVLMLLRADREATADLVTVQRTSRVNHVVLFTNAVLHSADSEGILSCAKIRST